MLVGNVGSSQLMDYTAVGTEAQAADKLEEANKNFGTLVLISAGTYEQVKDDVEARELDHVKVYARAQPTTVYELLALKGGLHFDRTKVLELYGQGLLLYRQRKFDEAAKRFEAALQLDQGDGPSQRMLRLCRKFTMAPPPPTWDGVSQLEEERDAQ
jgi:adenylate cyclase